VAATVHGCLSDNGAIAEYGHDSKVLKSWNMDAAERRYNISRLTLLKGVTIMQHGQGRKGVTIEENGRG
jgi:hypothetical protein